MLVTVAFGTIRASIFLRPFRHAPLFAAPLCPRLAATSKNTSAHTFTFPIDAGLSTANKRSSL